MREPAHDAASFTAGMRCGARVGACLARAAALELLERGRWWSRWRYRLMARTLVAFAEELEQEAEAVERAREEWPGSGRRLAAVPGLAPQAEEPALDS